MFYKIFIDYFSHIATDKFGTHKAVKPEKIK